MVGAGEHDRDTSADARLAHGIGRFPTIVATDLEGHRYRVPRELPGSRNVVVLAFAREQQPTVDSWRDRLDSVLPVNANVEVWEVPVISAHYRVARPAIEGGMRASIPEGPIRTHTLTAYTDPDKLAHSLGLDSTQTVHVFLVSEEGRILWHAHGGPEGVDLDRLLAALDGKDG